MSSDDDNSDGLSREHEQMLYFATYTALTALVLSLAAVGWLLAGAM
jgi:hypothetical protein